MRIPVKSRDFGFWTSKPVTVYRVEVDDDYREIVWCNHDGYFEDELAQERIASDGTVHEMSVKAEVCDKCYAWRPVGAEEWADAPILGERIEQHATV